MRIAASAPLEEATRSLPRLRLVIQRHDVRVVSMIALRCVFDGAEQQMELEEKLQRDLDVEDDDMTLKLINLPAVMCRASNGELFTVDTQ